MTNINFTLAERQILANQYKILSIIDKGKLLANNYENLIEILESGYIQKYGDVISVSEEEVPFEVTNETYSILSMFKTLGLSTEKLSQEEKDGIENFKRLKFRGFDAGHDPHYAFAEFIIERGGLHGEQKGKNLNSHGNPDLEEYRKMLEFHKKRQNPYEHYSLEELVQIASIW